MYDLLTGGSHFLPCSVVFCHYVHDLWCDTCMKPCDIKLCCMDDVRKAMWYMIFCFVLSVNSWFSVWVAFVVLVSVCGGCIWNSVLVQQFILVRIESVMYIVFNVFNFLKLHVFQEPIIIHSMHTHYKLQEHCGQISGHKTTS